MPGTHGAAATPRATTQTSARKSGTAFKAPARRSPVAPSCSTPREQGWEPPREEGCALDWDSVIGGGAIVDANWLEAREVPEARDWHPARELIRYLELLFEAGDTVGYVTSAWWNEEGGRFLPSRGNWDRTAGELIEALSRCGDDIGSVLGDYRPEAGAWIRFNPLDGRGCKNENVTDFRWALVESDTMDIERQFALICELELPACVVVHSGGKSLHAIVHIGAANYEEYRRRVDYLYAVCEKNGLKIDSQNRNPSRLSRMPGAMRAGKRQYIVAENIGKENYEQWREWIEGIQDGPAGAGERGAGVERPAQTLAAAH